MMSRVTLCAVLACCMLTACRSNDEPAERTVPGDTIAGDSVFDPSEERVTLPSSRIYYTLTNHEWYARGEPLVHEGRPYEPEGMPVDATLPDMTRLGEYEGVEYYARRQDAEPFLYVPVFDGYWQRFRADPTAVASPADAASDSAADGDLPADSMPGVD